MATDFFASDYSQWTARQQNIFDSMADNVGSDIIYEDQILQAYVDVLFNGPVQELPRGDEREDIMNALISYVHDSYGYDFVEVWDWQAWREAYGTFA